MYALRSRTSIAGVLAALSALLGGCAGGLQLPSGDIANAGPPAAILQPGEGELAGRQILALPQRSAGFNMATFMAGAGAYPAVAAARTADNLYDVVTVHWGTDRLVTPKPEANPSDPSMIVTGSSAVRPVAMPGSERSQSLTLGRAHVTVPRIARDKGSIQRPWRVGFLDWRLYEEREDPRRHFTIATLEMTTRKEFLRSAADSAAPAQRFPKQALVFVHGFNVSFDDALYRTAQLSYDLEFDGATYLYSWPSRAQPTAYLHDRDSADRARTFLLEFLEIVARESGAERVHVVAHSLGARPLVEALSEARRRPDGARSLKLGQLMLAAADIDRDVFAGFADVLKSSAKGTTLYAAANDRVLQASRVLASGRARAGEITDDGPMILRGVDTIDISDAGTDALLAFNHATYAEGNGLAADMRLLMREGVRPPDRRLPIYAKVATGQGPYWRYRREIAAQQ